MTYPKPHTVVSPDVRALTDALGALYGVDEHAPRLVYPTVSVLGERATVAQAAEAIRRTDWALLHPRESTTPTSYDGLVSPVSVFEIALSRVIHAPVKAEGLSRLRRLSDWWAAWGRLQLGLPCNFVCSPCIDGRYGWITPDACVALVAHPDDKWYDVRRLACDAVNMAAAFPWLVCDLAVYGYDETDPEDRVTGVVAAVKIEKGVATAARIAPPTAEGANAYLDQVLKLADAAHAPYKYSYDDFDRDWTPTAPDHLPPKLTRCQWTIPELEVLWAEAIAATGEALK